MKTNLTDKEVIEAYTLSPEEVERLRNYRGDVLALAVRIKCFEHLINHNFSLSDVPQKVVDYVASQLQVAPFSLEEKKDPRYEQIQLIRKYTGFSPFSETERSKLETWMQAQAEKQFHRVDLVNEAIFHLKENLIELPAFASLVRLAAHALHQADLSQCKLLNQNLSQETKALLDALLQSELRYQRTPFYELKEPPESPSASAIQKEIRLLQRLKEFDIPFENLQLISGEKIKHFFEIAQSYKSRELLDLSPERRYPILLCFISMRIKQVTDNIVELFIRLWNQTTKEAEKVQNEYALKKAEVKQQSDELSEQLLEIIVESGSKDEIVDRIFDLYSYDEYKSLLLMIRRFKQPKTVKYYQALAARYSFVRRFLPLIWENLTFFSNTSNQTLIESIQYIKETLDPSIPELPVRGAPTGFVPDDWDPHVFTRQRGTRKILSINKSMYELCLVEQLIDAIIAGEITVCDSQYYSSMEESLISFEEFFANRGDYLKKLRLPESGEEFVRKLADELKSSLNKMDQNYETLLPHTKVSRGSLSFTRITKRKLLAEIEHLRDRVGAHMSNVSIIDILVDVDKLTGFLDYFETVGYREVMRREEKAKRMIAMLLCYGCNIGPAQTQRSTGVAAASILYMRRRYCSEENLLKVIGFLSDCQHQTWLAQSYGDGTGFITDGSMYSAPKRSMHTEPHFRYSKGRGVISYPLVSDQYVALITSAIPCSQYEAIEMFESVFKQKSHLPLLKNFSDSHGQSLLAFAFARLLSIDLLPRLRARKHKVLYKAGKQDNYPNLNDAIHGIIQWKYIRRYYEDFIRIVVSFYERKASPAHILLKIAALRNTNGLKRAALELGKVCRSLFLMRIGMNTVLRGEIQNECLKGERWHEFGKEIFIGHGGKLQEDSLEEQYRTLLMLNVVLNCIALWNTLAIQGIVSKLRAEGHSISDAHLAHLTPTMTHHIDLIGKFEIDLFRRVPFKFSPKKVEQQRE